MRTRLESIDSLRGIAALLVMLFHYTSQYEAVFGHVSPPLVLFDHRHVGLLLFFAISGLVGLLAVDSGRSPMELIYNRLTRLYPAYWAALLVTALVLWWFPLRGREITAWQVLVNATMLQSLVGVRHVDGVYWTMWYTLVFYVGAVGIRVLFRSREIPWEGLSVLWLGAAGIAGLVGNLEGERLDDALRHLFLLRYVNYFVIGIIAYRIRVVGGSWCRFGLLASAVLVQPVIHPGFVPLWVPVVVAVITTAVATGRLVLRNKVLSWVGSVSYPLYLVHQNIGYVVIERLSPEIGTQMAIFSAIVVAFLLAFGLHRYVEQPMLRGLRAAWARKARVASRPLVEFPRMG